MSDQDALNKIKLTQLADAEGFDTPQELIEDRHVDSLVPGICMANDCTYTCDIEPDQTAGWCEACEGNSVMSCLELWWDGACDA